MSILTSFDIGGGNLRVKCIMMALNVEGLYMSHLNLIDIALTQNVIYSIAFVIFLPLKPSRDLALRSRCVRSQMVALRRILNS